MKTRLVFFICDAAEGGHRWRLRAGAQAPGATDRSIPFGNVPSSRLQAIMLAAAARVRAHEGARTLVCEHQEGRKPRRRRSDWFKLYILGIQRHPRIIRVHTYE